MVLILDGSSELGAHQRYLQYKLLTVSLLQIYGLNKIFLFLEGIERVVKSIFLLLENISFFTLYVRNMF